MSFLFPIEYILSLILKIWIRLTHNYGFSLICMSATVTLLLYPLYRLAEKWRDEEKGLKTAMQNDLNEIKKIFSGQKAFYLTQATYKIYGYKSWYTIKTSLGLLIQIPLFFAAYNVISQYSEFTGKSFSLIADLGLPDNLCYGINILPVLMTAINICSGIMYSRSFRLKDNIQMLVFAFLFFFLLYNSPSALLIYWTMNNFFSLLKNIFTRKKTPYLKPDCTERQFIKELLQRYAVFLAVILAALIIINYWKFSKYVLAFSMLSLAIYLVLYKKYKILILHFPTVILILLCSLFYILKLPVNGLHRIDFIKFTLECCIIYLFFTAIRFPLKEQTISRREFYYIVCAAIYMLVDICILHPIRFYVQSPAEIGGSFFKILVFSFFLFAAIIACLALVFFIKKKITYSTFYFILFLLVTQIVYTYIVQYDAGVLTGFAMSNDIYLKKIHIVSFLTDCIIGFLILAFIIYIVKYKIKFLGIFFLILFTVQLSIITMTVVKSKILFTHNFSVKQQEKVTLPQEVYDIHNFSKTGVNFIYLIPDMCNSEYIKRLQNDIPDFNTVFEGFTYYPDSLSVSGWTETSLPALWAGQDFAPKKNNENNISVYDAEKQASDIFDKTFQQAGYDVSKLSISAETGEMNIYGKYYMQNNNIGFINVEKKKILPMLSLLNSVPHSIKPLLYDSSRWLVFNEILTFAFHRVVALRSVGYLDLLPEISGISNSKPKALFIRSELTHSPFGILEDGSIVTNSYPDEIEKSFNSGTAAYYSAKLFFEYTIKWFDWLKENGIYDNTAIAIVSDHGNNCFDNNIPVKKDMDPLHISRSNALIMIKPPYKKGDMVTDSKTLLSNGDVIGIIGNMLDIPHSFDINNSSTRCYAFMLNLEELYNQIIPQSYAEYNVTGSIFDSHAWEKDTEK